MQLARVEGGREGGGNPLLLSLVLKYSTTRSEAQQVHADIYWLVLKHHYRQI